MNQVFTIAEREFVVRIRAKSTIVTLIVVMVVFLGSGLAVRLFNLGSDEAEADVIGLTAQTRSYAELLETGSGFLFSENEGSESGFPRYRTRVYSLEKELERSVQNGEVLAGIGGTLSDPVLISKGDFPAALGLLVKNMRFGLNLAQYVSSLGGDMSEFSAEMMSKQIKVRDLSVKDSDGSEEDFNLGSYISGLAMIMIIFMMTLFSGQFVAMGIVEEKSSRVVEVLVSAVSPAQLLTGKILGITAVVIVQFLVIGGSAVSALVISGFDDSLQLSLSSFLGWFVVWFLLGLMTYMMLYAGSGALASKQEEVAQSTVVLSLLQVVGFYGGIYALFSPSQLVVKIASMVPFLNCYVMPARQVASANVQWWEPLISVLVNLVVLPFLVWIGAWLYARGVLATGKRVRVKELLRQRN